ncbi:hypothetical protein [[Eubacterium] hominis]|uniref:hypothetical protein n=1 Tax=[Eubacterium] hominis TaxID=2764325 RepID=UPI0022E6DAFA
MKYQFKEAVLVVDVDTRNEQVIKFLERLEILFYAYKNYNNLGFMYDRIQKTKGIIEFAHELELIDFDTRYDLWQYVDRMADIVESKIRGISL